MKHINLFLFAPMLPAMEFQVARGHVVVQVSGGPGGGVNAVGMKEQITRERFFHTKFMNLKASN